MSPTWPRAPYRPLARQKSRRVNAGRLGRSQPRESVASQAAHPVREHTGPDRPDLGNPGMAQDPAGGVRPRRRRPRGRHAPSRPRGRRPHDEQPGGSLAGRHHRHCHSELPGGAPPTALKQRGGTPVTGARRIPRTLNQCRPADAPQICSTPAAWGGSAAGSSRRLLCSNSPNAHAPHAGHNSPHRARVTTHSRHLPLQARLLRGARDVRALECREMITWRKGTRCRSSAERRFSAV